MKHFPFNKQLPTHHTSYKNSSLRYLVTFYTHALMMPIFLMNYAFGDANFEINYLDEANEGFYDTSPALPVGENTGTTLGEQRRIAFSYAISILERVLDSGVTIAVEANFDELGGSALSADLAFAGTKTTHWNFTGAPRTNVFYPSALANKLANRDLNPSGADISASFNASVDNDHVLGESGWYYGLDQQGSVEDTDFVTVTLHELLHGLGFLSLIDVFSGSKQSCANDNACSSGMDDVYSLFLERAGAAPADLLSMSDAQRSVAVTANREVRWTGNKTAAILSEWINQGTSDNKPLIYTPSILSAGSTLSHLDTSLLPNSMMEPFYIQANHEIGLATGILADIGWGNLADLAMEFMTATENINSISSGLIVENLGPDNAPAHEIEITAINTHFNSPATSNNGTCQTSSNLISCQLNQLNSGDQASISFTVENNENTLLNAHVTTGHIEVTLNNNNPSLAINNNSNSSSEDSSTTPTHSSDHSTDNSSDHSTDNNSASSDSLDSDHFGESPNNLNTSGGSTPANAVGTGGGSHGPLSILLLLSLSLLRQIERKLFPNLRGRFLNLL